MSAVIVIEVVVGIIVLAAVVRFAVRDTRQRSESNVGQDVEAADVAGAPAEASEPKS